jgi:hypothetical protein
MTALNESNAIAELMAINETAMTEGQKSVRCRSCGGFRKFVCDCCGTKDAYKGYINGDLFRCQGCAYRTGANDEWEGMGKQYRDNRSENGRNGYSCCNGAWTDLPEWNHCWEPTEEEIKEIEESRIPPSTCERCGFVGDCYSNGNDDGAMICVDCETQLDQEFERKFAAPLPQDLQANLWHVRAFWGNIAMSLNARSFTVQSEASQYAAELRSSVLELRVEVIAE